MVFRCASSVGLSSGFGTPFSVDVGEAGVLLSLETDCSHQLDLRCWSCSQCLFLGPGVDGSSVQEEEKA